MSVMKKRITGCDIAGTVNARLPEVPYRPTVPALLHRAVELYGDDDFVVLPDERLTFADAERRSGALALRLLAAGAGKGTRVGIVLPTGVDWVVAWLAAARVGALAMLFPATYRPEELRRSLVIGDVAILFAPHELFGQDYPVFLEEAVAGLARHRSGPILAPAAPYLRAIWMPGSCERSWATPYSDAAGPTVPGEGSSAGEELLTAVEAAISPADPLLVIFTSGSSADPKAVVHTHGAAIRKIQPELGMCLAGSFPGRTFCAMPFFWVGGPQDLLGALHSGATVVTQARFEATGALELLERERCTSIVGWANLLDRLEQDPTFPSRDLSALSLPALAHSSRGHPRNLGMTETFGPHANREWFDYRVIDPGSGRALEDGEEGEFLVRGFGLMAGLYKQEREAVFDPDGWYHTGDRGYVEDGTIWFTGRYSEAIKSAGANVAPLEVERVLQSLPGVALALVVGVPDPGRGQAVAAAVVPAPGASLDIDDLRQQVNRRLSGYKVPTRWRVLQPHQVPWLASGKANKRAVAELFRERVTPGSG
jgi:acyl-CoA synthetase (AMP-forming)/AMP-acid ligase II